MYTAYVLTPDDVLSLLTKYSPSYSTFIGHHVTETFGVSEDVGNEWKAQTLRSNPTIKVLGKIDSGDGLEALVVSIDGNTTRQDGGKYHITWSLDDSRYKPKDSNTLIRESNRYTMSLPITINAVPDVLG